MHILVTMVFVSTFIITGLFGLNIESASAQSPTVSLEARINRGSQSAGDITISSAGDIIINPGDNVFLQWSSTNAEYCEGTGTGFLAGNFISGVAGVTEPTVGNSTVYTVTCYGNNSISSSDSVTVTTRQVSGNNTVNTIPPESPTPTGPSTPPIAPPRIPTGPTGTPTPPPGTPTGPTGTPTPPPGTPTPPPQTPPTLPPQTPQVTGKPPSISFERKVGRDPWSGQDAVINYGEEVTLKWYAKNADLGCVANDGYGFSTRHPDPSYTGPVNRFRGTDSIIEPKVGDTDVYILTCANSNSVAAKSIAITTKADANTPTAELQVALHKDGQYVQDWTTDDVTIGPGEQVFMAWKSTNATSCRGGRYNFRIPKNQAAGGVDETLTEPGNGYSYHYILSCTGPGGTVQDIIVVSSPESARQKKNRNPFDSDEDDTPTADGSNSPPTIDMKVALYSTVSCRVLKPWTASKNINLKSNAGVALAWKISNATACATNGNDVDIFTRKMKTGVDVTVTEPKGGESTTYTIICTGPGGTSKESITVTNPAPAPSSMALEREVDGVWTSSSGAVNPGETINMRWRSTNVTGCTGSGIDTEGNTNGTASGIVAPAPGSSKTYSVSCTTAGGTINDNITITTNTEQSDSNPHVTLEMKIGGRKPWSTSDDVFTSSRDLTKTIKLKWDTGGVSKCRSNGNGLTTTYVKGFDYTVDRPTKGKGDSKTYTIICTNGKGVSVSDSITVTNNFGSSKSSGSGRG